MGTIPQAERDRRVAEMRALVENRVEAAILDVARDAAVHADALGSLTFQQQLERTQGVMARLSAELIERTVAFRVAMITAGTNVQMMYETVEPSQSPDITAFLDRLAVTLKHAEESAILLAVALQVDIKRPCRKCGDPIDPEAAYGLCGRCI